MKAVIVIILTSLIMCEGPAPGEDQDTCATRWYISNESNERLYFFSEITDLDEIGAMTKVEIRTRSSGRIYDYDDFFKYGYWGNGVIYDELVLMDSMKSMLLKWSIHDADINKRHIMNSEAWEGKQYVVDGITYMDWTYTITTEDLERIRH